MPRHITLLFLLLTGLYVFSQNEAVIDSLVNGLENAPTDSAKFAYADELFWQWIYIDQTKGYEYGLEALGIAKRMSAASSIAAAQNNLAIYFRMAGRYVSGDSILQEAIKLQEQKQDTHGLARSYGNLSNIYKIQGEYEKAIEVNLASMTFYEALKDTVGVGRCLNNNGNLHFALKQNEEALTYFLQALEISRRFKDTLGLALNLGNIGTAYKQLNQTQEGLEAYEEANVYLESLGYERSLAYNLGNMGLLFREGGDFPKAYAYLNEAKSLLERNKAPKGLARMYDNLAKTALMQQSYSRALEYAREGYELAKSIQLKPEIRNAYQSLAKAYAGQGNFSQAYAYQEKFIALNDSLINEGNTQKIQELEARYESRSRESRIQLLASEKELQQKTIEAQVAGIRLRNLIIMTVAFALGLAVLGLVFYRQKKLLAESMQQIEQQKVMDLKNQQQIIRMDAVIQGEEKERRRLAQDLHDGIGGMLAAAKLKVASVSTHKDEMGEASTLLDDTYEEVRRIAHNMMPKILLEMGLVPAVKQYAQQLSDSSSLAISVEVLQSMPELTSHQELSLFRIIQELLNNVVKHAEANKASVQFSFFEGEVSIMVEDDGKGFDPVQAKGGMGMKNLEDRIAILGGEWEIDSRVGKGTNISIHIPVIRELMNSL
ncbi:MAG: sensor histidine kinase [Bacteroidota bacterium]